MIGGISYFHTYAYDLLATNERITAASCDAAIKAHRRGRLQKVTYLSSSMVFESADTWPSYEGQEHDVPPPRLVLRLPEAGRRVLRPGGVRPVRVAVHHHPAVQLRRDRRAPSARRRRDPERQRHVWP